MRKIRYNTFETNSSSTHSITMCTGEEYEKWKKGEIFFVRGLDDFVNKEQAVEIIKKLIINEKIKTNYDEKTMTFKEITLKYDSYEDKEKKKEKFIYTKENLDEITEEDIAKFYEEEFDIYEFPLTFEDYKEKIGYEQYYDEFITKSGEKVVAFGYYGNDY